MQQDKSSSQPAPEEKKPVAEKTIKAQDVIQTCRDAIRTCDLENLLTTAKKSEVHGLNELEKEKFCAGMIMLGEALTFCRDQKRWEIAQADISGCATRYARIRNYFIHHVMYGCPEKYKEFKSQLAQTEPIGTVLKKLSDLEEAFNLINAGTPIDQRDDTLSKKILPGKNDFQFEYMHIFECLKNELTKLNETLEQTKTAEHLNDSTRTMLDNRVRNIMTIMLDLTDVDNGNTHLTKPCNNLKEAAKLFNINFISEHAEFAAFFKNLRKDRNSLCHLDSSLNKPYRNDSELIEFACKFQDLYKKKYLDGIQEALLSAPKEIVEDTIKSTMPVAEKEEGSAKKPKQEEVGLSRRKSTALDKLSVYNTESKKGGDNRSKSPDAERERKRSSGRSFGK